MSRSTDLARVGGFHNGEGSVFWSKRTLTFALVQSSDKGIPSDLAHAQKVLDCGYITGPYIRAGNTHRKPEYKFRIYGITKVPMILKKLWPYLSDEKQVQANKALAKVL